MNDLISTCCQCRFVNVGKLGKHIIAASGAQDRRLDISVNRGFGSEDGIDLGKVAGAFDSGLEGVLDLTGFQLDPIDRSKPRMGLDVSGTVLERIGAEAELGVAGEEAFEEGLGIWRDGE